MNRRTVVSGLGQALLATAIAPRIAFGNADAAASTRAAFRRALAEHPWLAAMRGLDVDALEPASLRIEGRMPPGLRGTLYRNGPAKHEVGGVRYDHWFDGDGMVHAWTLGDEGVTHAARMVHTHKYLAERDAGRPLYPGFGTAVENGRPMSGPDSVNAANISVLPIADELWALWEAGSPWRLDPDTLESLGPKRFSPESAGLPFSAHPRVAPDGTVWNFGYASGARRLVFWRIEGDGRLGRITTLPVEETGMPHDFVVTERHLVLLLAPLHQVPGRDARTFLDAHEWRPERPTRVLVMDLEDLETHRWLELPAQWVFHFGNAFEDGDGVIRFDGASAPDPSFMFGGARAIMRGVPRDPAEPWAKPVLYRIDPRRGRAEQTPLAADDLASEFPAVDPRRATRRHRYVTTLTRRAGDAAVHDSHTTVSRLDLETGAVVGYRYPETEVPEEHLFVPDPERPDEAGGWIVGTSVDWKAGATHLNVLRADAVADGPVARATLPRVLPLGLHGRFAARPA